MSQSNQLLNKNFVLRGDWHAVIPHTDGDIRFAEVTGASCKFAMEDDTLEQVILGQSQVVDREITKVSATLSLAFREAISASALDLFVGQGVPQTFSSAYKMACTREMLNLYNTDKLYVPIPYGILQQHTAAEFPAPTAVSGADTVASGSITTGTYYAWVIPLYTDQDPHRAWTPTLPFGTDRLRGVDFVFGTPSSASSPISAAGSKGMTVGWSGISPAAGMPTPDYYAVVLGTTNVLTAGTSKICAIVAYPLLTATFTALGTDEFGATPLITDLFRLQRITNPSGTRVFVDLTSGSDYVYDKATGCVNLTSSGSSSHSGKGFRIVTWFCQSPSVIQSFGSSNTTERVLPVRLMAIHGSGANVNTRRPVGAIANLWEVDFARLPDELLSSPGKRFHTPKTVSLPANWNSAKGAIGEFEAYSPDFANLIDFFSSSVLP